MKQIAENIFMHKHQYKPPHQNVLSRLENDRLRTKEKLQDAVESYWLFLATIVPNTETANCEL